MNGDMTLVRELHNPVRRAKRKLMRDLHVSPRRFKKLRKAIRRKERGHGNR